jgi:dynein heavy chain
LFDCLIVGLLDGWVVGLLDGWMVGWLVAGGFSFRKDFVEDINNILNTGEVPNLYENDMKSEIIETLRKPCAAAVGHNDSTSKEILTYFVEQIKAHLHIVLAFSPVSEQFRKRLLMFPSLINCCTIDWFDKWPTEALKSVAEHFLADQDMETMVKDAVVETCVDMQERVTAMSAKFLNELRRNYYVTPTSYLELIKTFKALIGKKRDEGMWEMAMWKFEKLGKFGNDWLMIG